MKTSVFIATSLDGFIARTDGSIDWLFENGSDEGEDYGFKEFMESVDALVMGRNSYEKVLTFDTWPYGTKPVVVLSSREVDIPHHVEDTVESMSGTPGDVVARLAERGAKHLYIDGGKTIQGFLSEGLIDHFTITTIPVLLGEGIPLFGPLPKDVKLRHVETRSYPSGFVQSRYDVRR